MKSNPRSKPTAIAGERKSRMRYHKLFIEFVITTGVLVFASISFGQEDATAPNETQVAELLTVYVSPDELEDESEENSPDELGTKDKPYIGLRKTLKQIRDKEIGQVGQKIEIHLEPKVYYYKRIKNESLSAPRPSVYKIPGNVSLVGSNSADGLTRTTLSGQRSENVGNYDDAHNSVVEICEASSKDSRVVLDNINITHGNASFDDASDHERKNGGGIYVGKGQHLYLSFVSVQGNYSVEQGGGIYNAGDLTLEKCSIAGNRAEKEGGGVFTALEQALDGETKFTPVTRFMNSVVAMNESGVVGDQGFSTADVNVEPKATTTSSSLFGTLPKTPSAEFNKPSANPTDPFASGLSLFPLAGVSGASIDPGFLNPPIAPKNKRVPPVIGDLRPSRSSQLVGRAKKTKPSDFADIGAFDYPKSDQDAKAVNKGRSIIVRPVADGNCEWRFHDEEYEAKSDKTTDLVKLFEFIREKNEANQDYKDDIGQVLFLRSSENAPYLVKAAGDGLKLFPHVKLIGGFRDDKQATAYANNPQGNESSGTESIFDGNDQSRIFVGQYCRGVEIKRLVLRNAKTSGSGSAIDISRCDGAFQSQIKADHLVIYNCQAGASGGGISVFGKMDLTHCSIVANSSGVVGIQSKEDQERKYKSINEGSGFPGGGIAVGLADAKPQVTLNKCVVLLNRFQRPAPPKEGETAENKKSYIYQTSNVKNQFTSVKNCFVQLGKSETRKEIGSGIHGINHALDGNYVLLDESIPLKRGYKRDEIHRWFIGTSKSNSSDSGLLRVDEQIQNALTPTRIAPFRQWTEDESDTSKPTLNTPRKRLDIGAYQYQEPKTRFKSVGNSTAEIAKAIEHAWESNSDSNIENDLSGIRIGASEIQGISASADAGDVTASSNNEEVTEPLPESSKWTNVTPSAQIYVPPFFSIFPEDVQSRISIKADPGSNQPFFGLENVQDVNLAGLNILGASAGETQLEDQPRIFEDTGVTIALDSGMQSRFIVDSCRFSGWNRGAMQVKIRGSEPNLNGTGNIVRSEFVENQSDFGGAIFNAGFKLQLAGCFFGSNHSYSYSAQNGEAVKKSGGNGGAVHNSASPLLSLSHCTFSGNSAKGIGSSVVSWYSNFNIANSTICNSFSDRPGDKLVASVDLRFSNSTKPLCRLENNIFAKNHLVDVSFEIYDASNKPYMPIDSQKSVVVDQEKVLTTKEFLNYLVSNNSIESATFNNAAVNKEVVPLASYRKLPVGQQTYLALPARLKGVSYLGSARQQKVVVPTMSPTFASWDFYRDKGPVVPDLVIPFVTGKIIDRGLGELVTLKHGDSETLVTHTDSGGRFRFRNIPVSPEWKEGKDTGIVVTVGAIAKTVKIILVPPANTLSPDISPPARLLQCEPVVFDSGEKDDQ